MSAVAAAKFSRGGPLMEGSPAVRNITVKVTVPPRSFLSTLIRHLVPLPLGGIRAELSRRAAESRPRELESSRLGAVAPRGGSCPRAGLVRQWARWARAAERGGACCSGHHVYGHGNVVARIPRVKPRCPTSERDYSGRHLSALGPSTTTGCIGSSERGAQESPRRALVAPKGSQRRARIVRGTEQLGAALARAPKWGPQEEPHVHPNGGPQNSLRRHTR